MNIKNSKELTETFIKDLERIIDSLGKKSTSVFNERWKQSMINFELIFSLNELAEILNSINRNIFSKDRQNIYDFLVISKAKKDEIIVSIENILEGNLVGFNPRTLISGLKKISDLAFELEQLNKH